MNLYEMSDQYRNLLKEINAQDEIPEEVMDALGLLEGDIRDKAVNMAAIVRNLEAERDAIRDAASIMQARYKSVDSKVARLADFLRSGMELAQLNEIRSPYFDIRIRKNPPSVSVIDEDEIPPEYFAVKTESRLDRAMVAGLLKDGMQIPGVELVQKTRLEIR